MYTDGFVVPWVPSGGGEGLRGLRPGGHAPPAAGGRAECPGDQVQLHDPGLLRHGLR